jgi:hypothetical protein
MQNFIQSDSFHNGNINQPQILDHFIIITPSYTFSFLNKLLSSTEEWSKNVISRAICIFSC